MLGCSEVAGESGPAADGGKAEKLIPPPRQPHEFIHTDESTAVSSISFVSKPLSTSTTSIIHTAVAPGARRQLTLDDVELQRPTLRII